MSSPVTEQANKVWQLLTASSTANVYKQAVDVTWTILKETAQLLWLVLCLVLVAGDWFWKQSIAAGKNTRAWVNEMTSPTAKGSTDPGETATQMWQSFLTSSQAASKSLITKARQQLDLPPEPTTPAVSTATKPPTPTPSTPTTSTKPTAPATDASKVAVDTGKLVE